MIIERRLPWSTVLIWATPNIVQSSAWSLIVYLGYSELGLSFLRLPFLPIATVGTAVAFYVGFKNNAAYDRFWEGRQIWGGIVNASRTFAVSVQNYVHATRGTGASAGDATASEGPVAHIAALTDTHRRLIYRHLAWVNALRLQLRKTSRFFDKPTAWTRRRMERHAEHMRNDWHKELSPFLDAEELAAVSAQANPATHLLARQAADLRALHDDRALDLFHQIELMRQIETFYGHQGACERIKNTPLPRQYAEFSRMFVKVFVFLIPFGLLDVFAERINEAQAAIGWIAPWLPAVPMILSSALVSWVFRVMEGIGDASEDPFERSMNDVPMNALSRTIEIDLRSLLGETDLPAKEERIDNLLY